MTQKERVLFLIKYLKAEDKRFSYIQIPNDEKELFILYRGLVNIRAPKEISLEYIRIEDEYLRQKISDMGYVELKDTEKTKSGFYLYRGDIVRLKLDAIVNAANAQMLGCFVPNHHCIDNAIHSFAGVSLRLYLKKCMDEISFAPPVLISPAFNLPAKYILHAAGPIVRVTLRQKDKDELQYTYTELIKAAKLKEINSIAFCCISTGEYGFPKAEAAQIAVNTLSKHKDDMEIVFNVFTDEDERIYRELTL